MNDPAPRAVAASEQIVLDFGEAVAQRDFARMAELLDDNVNYEICGIEMPGAGVMRKDELLERFPEVLSLFEAGGPRMTVTRMFHDGNWVIAESTGAGRFCNGTEYDNRYIIVYEIVDGRIRTVREYMDTQHGARLFAEGAVPTPTTKTNEESSWTAS
jgi:ketosteroid isomerase-like protein